MKLEFKLEGQEQVLSELRRLAAQFPDAAGAALYQEGFAIQARAQDLCPVDEGRLEKTAYTSPPQMLDGQAAVEVGFGTAYAVIQHERTEFRHRVGEAKFLEKAVNAARAGMLGRLAARIRQNVERGTRAPPISEG
jgi:hypothetical protein